MKLTRYLPWLGALGFLPGSDASPIAGDGLTVKTDSSLNEGSLAHVGYATALLTASGSGDVGSDDTTDFNDAVDLNPSSLFQPQESGLIKRQESSRFKLHLVAAGGRVLSIIVVDYLINNLPGTSDDRITADFGTGNNSPGNGPIKTAFFEGTEFRSDVATFDLATKAVSGVFQFNLNHAGLVTGLVQTAGVHVGNLVGAKYLRMFNGNNKLFATQYL